MEQDGAPDQAGGLSRKHMIEACALSLRRLKMEYVALYHIHRWGFSAPVEETLEAPGSLSARWHGVLLGRE